MGCSVVPCGSQETPEHNETVLEAIVDDQSDQTDTVDFELIRFLSYNIFIRMS